MNKSPTHLETDTEVHLKSQIQLAQRMLSIPAEVTLEWRESVLPSILSLKQSAALAAFKEAAQKVIADLDLSANSHAMRSLLGPNEAIHHVKAFFKHAKARAMEFGLIQFEALINTHTEGYDSFLAYSKQLFQNVSDSNGRLAAQLTAALVGQDSTTQDYTKARTQAVMAQGREEAYADLLDLFERLVVAT